ncbi:MAG: PEGA domain-containing protein [Candidatus Neomarinimicrobiota bacterium]
MEDTTLETFGYLVVECDSPGINIYVDDMLAGHVPIEKPIPLPPGQHTVTYLQPEFMDLLHQYYGEDEIKRMISKALETVYIVPGQTVSVNLWWRPYDKELKSRKLRFLAKSFAGVVLAATLFVLNMP